MGCRLRTCCCCGTLPTGSIIIGALSILGSVIGIVLFIVQKGQQTHQNSKAVQIVAILIYLTMIAFSILMILGVVKKNWGFIVPWLVADGILIGLQIIYCIIVVAALFSINQVGLGIGYLIICILASALAVYLWLVPYSYHIDLREDVQGVTYNQGPNKGHA